MKPIGTSLDAATHTNRRKEMIQRLDHKNKNCESCTSFKKLVGLHFGDSLDGRERLLASKCD
jgi:hypothetical protein